MNRYLWILIIIDTHGLILIHFISLNINAFNINQIHGLYMTLEAHSVAN